MWHRLTAEKGYLKADLYGRETAEQTRGFFAAVEAELVHRRWSRLLISVHSSNAVFTVDKLGLGGIFDRLVGVPLKIALLGDSDALRIAHSYIETLARQRGVGLRAFDDEKSAVRWLREPTARDAG